MPPQLREPPLAAWLVRRGWVEVWSIDERAKRWRLSAGPGQWIVVPPGPREQRFHPDCALLSVACEVAWPDGTSWLSQQEGLPMVFSAADHPQLERHAVPMAQLAKRIMGNDWHLPSYPMTAKDFLRLQQYFHRWLQAFHATLQQAGMSSNDRAALDPRLQAYVQQLDQWALHQHPDWERLAQTNGMSSVHADRLYRRAMGHSAATSWQQRRLHYAKRSLLMPGVVSKSIAADLGFASPAAFSRWFKQHTKQSPRQWRQKINNE